jgi:hypothetical protein
LVALTLVSKANWLEVFGALFTRQQVPVIIYKKILIVFLFAAILIDFGYESIISSHII